MEFINEKLVEKIAKAVGILYDPKGLKLAIRDFTRIVYAQGANKDDLSIEEKCQVIEDYRFFLSKDRNRQIIIEKAQGHLNEEAQPENVSDSWILHFWDKAGTVTDSILQDMIQKSHKIVNYVKVI